MTLRGTSFAVATAGSVRENTSDTPFSMPELSPTAFSHNLSAGHVSVHLDPSQATDIPFLFEQQQKRMGPAVAASMASHIAVGLVALLIVRWGSSTVKNAVFVPQPSLNQIVWLSEPGPGGGGGGGGNRMKEPPRQAELPGKEKITVPVTKAPTLEAPKRVKDEPNPVAQLNIPAKSLASAVDSLPGQIEAPPGPPTASLGSGSGGGAGTGTGTGIGPGTGSGLGPGSGGGTGGGVYHPGNGVTTPRLVREVKPQYSADAMRAKIQGTVWVQCVVRPDGSVSDVEVIRSLDPVFGLDQEAVKAARQWRFQPGTRLGEPVPVQITIELTFTLR
jgi:protein TonB